MSNEKNTEIVVLDGYGLSIKVEKGHLVCSDGIAKDRREFRFSRVSKLKRLVILGHTGAITFDAIRFLHDLGAALVMIDADGEVLMCESAMVMNHSAIRRAQALTAGTAKGFAILRELLTAKLKAQGMDTAELESATDLRSLRAAEAGAAGMYFSGWDLDVSWDKPVPEHWTRFQSRRSELGRSHNKRASDPLNAVLNYCYAILESECKIACLQLGLDPGLGLLHDDEKYKGRDNLVLDLMEPIRPIVDKFVRELAENGFRKEMFHEGRDGCVRVLAPLTTLLAQQAGEWRNHAARVAEDLCGSLMDSETVPTPLTGRKAKAAQKRAA